MERVQISAMAVPSAERFTKRVCFSDPQVLVFTLTFAPGQTLPAHKHPGSTVVLHVHTGAGVVSNGEREETVTSGDVLLVTAEEELGVRNTGTETLVLLVSLSPNPTNPAYSKNLG
ncbi:MAG TPA: cupin domain-containing protein [Symbiobacteriaceae bacterium]|nr:cupin domain-containing protein [Symbiobacteriaceae bacterium]